MRFSVNCKTG